MNVEPSAPYLHNLVQHCLWANSVWIEFVSTPASPDEYARARISHVLLSERAWFERIAGEEPGSDIWKVLSDAELVELHERNGRVYSGLLDGDTRAIVTFERFSGERGHVSVGDIIVHLVTHGAHHRGQLSRHFASSGHQSPNTDFIQYCLSAGS